MNAGELILKLPSLQTRGCAGWHTRLPKWLAASGSPRAAGKNF